MKRQEPIADEWPELCRPQQQCHASSDKVHHYPNLVVKDRVPEIRASVSIEISDHIVEEEVQG